MPSDTPGIDTSDLEKRLQELDQGQVHAVAPGDVQLTRQACNDPSRHIFSVAWQPAAQTLAAAGADAQALLSAALDRGALACAAGQLGVAQNPLRLVYP